VRESSKIASMGGMVKHDSIASLLLRQKMENYKEIMNTLLLSATFDQ
jgi:hypothetical protein